MHFRVEFSADFILEQSNLLYSNEHQHKIGIDGWTVEDNLAWRKKYAPPILRKLRAALMNVMSSPSKYPPVIGNFACTIFGKGGKNARA